MLQIFKFRIVTCQVFAFRVPDLLLVPTTLQSSISFQTPLSIAAFAPTPLFFILGFTKQFWSVHDHGLLVNFELSTFDLVPFLSLTTSSIPPHREKPLSISLGELASSICLESFDLLHPQENAANLASIANLLMTR